MQLSNFNLMQTSKAISLLDKIVKIKKSWKISFSVIYLVIYLKSTILNS